MFRSPRVIGIPAACSDGKFRARFADGVWSPSAAQLAAAAAARSNAAGGLVSAGGARLIFSHNFENNSLDPATPVVGQGLRSTPPSVSTIRAASGTHAALMRYGEGSNPELGYELADAVSAITVEYKLYIPVGYLGKRTEIGQGQNNKMWRAFSSTGYNSSEKIGMSSWGTVGQSEEVALFDLGAAGGNGASIGPNYGWENNIWTVRHYLPTDEGTWVRCRWHYRPPTGRALGQYGSAWFDQMKSGQTAWERQLDMTNRVNNYDDNPADPEAHDVKSFILMGPANSGFTQTMDFFIDDIYVWEGEYTG